MLRKWILLVVVAGVLCFFQYLYLFRSIRTNVGETESEETAWIENVVLASPQTSSLSFSSSSSSTRHAQVERFIPPNKYYVQTHRVLAMNERFVGENKDQMKLHQPIYDVLRSDFNFTIDKHSSKSDNKVKDADMLFIDTMAMGLSVLKQVSSKVNKHVILNFFGNRDALQCLGGKKSTQFDCRVNYAKTQGIEFNELGIQPYSYKLYVNEECKQFFQDVCPNKDNIWISKRVRGWEGGYMQLYSGCSKKLVDRFGKCNFEALSSRAQHILMQYIHNPTLIDGHKSDLRTYLLLSDIDPTFIFYHDGYVRKAGNKYNTDKLTDLTAHITNLPSQYGAEDFMWTFSRFQNYLQKEYDFPADFMYNAFRKHVAKVYRYLWQSMKSRMSDFPPSHTSVFHIIACDFLVSTDQKIHLLECNAIPEISDNRGLEGFPEIWSNMMDLLLKIHDPDEAKLKENLPPLVTGMYSDQKPFVHKNWTLVYNQLEEEYYNKTYDIRREWPTRY